jgi:hypothetical protein
MTVELIREIAGHVLALGLVGWGAYLTINSQEVPTFLVAAIAAIVGMYFPGMAQAVKARVYKALGGCC